MPVDADADPRRGQWIGPDRAQPPPQPGVEQDEFEHYDDAMIARKQAGIPA